MPTEDETKVQNAIQTVISQAALTRTVVSEGTVELTYESNNLSSLAPFRDLLKRERIRAAARTLMLGSLRGSLVTFSLNKQVAHAGKVSFATTDRESPLGPIEVRIETNEPSEVIDWLAPPAVER